MKRKVFSWLMALMLCLTLLPASAFAAEPAGADQTADFTAADGGEAAIALLTAAKWENAEAPT